MPKIPAPAKTNWKHSPVVYMGIDPGASGGIAMLSGGELTVKKMPQTEADLLDLIKTYDDMEIIAVLEHVHAMPKNGSISAFKLGMNYGALRMALTVANARFEVVSPMKWQRMLGISPRKTRVRDTTSGGEESRTVFKNRLKAMAQQLYPKVKVTLATADALLLLEYCLRLHRRDK